MKPNPNRQRHYLYRITHIPTGHYYIGMRSCRWKPERDIGYQGSGKALAEFRSGRPAHEFRKDILAVLGSREELAAEEARQVNAKTLRDPLCLNLCLGGGVGSLGYKHTSKARQVLRACHRRRKLQRASPALRAYVEYQRLRSQLKKERQGK